MARAKKQIDNETKVATETPVPAAKGPASVPAAPQAKRARRGFASWFFFLAFVAVSAWAYGLHQENRALRDPEFQARQVILKMSEHIILPEGELPAIQTVDRSRDKGAFFKNAQNGDIFVVYRSTRQAFIYSPTREILVNVGVLAVEPAQEEVSPDDSKKEEAAAEEGPAVAPEPVEN